MTRTDNVLNMHITIENDMKQELNIDFSIFSAILYKYELLSHIYTCFEEYNSIGLE